MTTQTDEMDGTNKNNTNVSHKKSRKKKSQWVYVKIGTRIVDVKKVAISADEDWDHITQTSKFLSHTEEKRNKEVWKWASGGKSITTEQVTKNTKQTSTRFVYKSEPKVVQQRGRPAKKLKSTLHPSLPKIVRSSPTPSPPARKVVTPTKNTSLVKKHASTNDYSSSPRGRGRLPERNPNSVKLNPINDNNLHTNKTKKMSKGTKVKSKKSEVMKNKEQEFNGNKCSSRAEGKSNDRGNQENKEPIDEGFASDYSCTGNGSLVENSSGDTTPSRDDPKSTTFKSDKPNIVKVRSNSLSYDEKYISFIKYKYEKSFLLIFYS